MMKKLFLPFQLVRGGFRFLWNYVCSGGLQRRTIYAFFYRYGKIKDRTILYEAFFGRGMLCNPYALFLEALQREGYTHIWAIADKEERKRLAKQYKKNHRVRFVKRDGFWYVRYLAGARYLVNNVTFPSYYTKRDGQVYVNTWHGIPLKTLGYDMPAGKTEVSNTMRNFLAADYLVSANDFLTGIYENAYKLKQVYDGKIIEEGYPRLDLLHRFSRTEIFEKLNQFGVVPEPDKKIILYAPTWKGVSYAQADAGVDGYFRFKEELEKRIDISKHQILIKVHQRVYQLAKDRLREPFFVPAMIDANEVLAVTDILISDFSSVFYDFLATGRPVLFFIEDAESYQEERGMYHGLDSLPGPYTDSMDTLAGYISRIEEVEREWTPRYEECRVFANAGKSGGIAKKVIDIVFEGKEQGYRIHTVEKGKKKLFLSRGKMLTNGITTSLINLLNCIDYDSYDVTLMIAKCPNDKTSGLIDQINDNVRVLYRNSTFNMTFFENICHCIRMKTGKGVHIFQKPYEREWRRCYADVSFDFLVDFEGYNHFYALMMLQNRGKNLSIWQHNDMMAEKEVRFPWLVKIFRLYRYFTNVVACSQEIMEVNREKMQGIYAEAGAFQYARNVVDFERVQQLAESGELFQQEGKTFYTVKEEEHVINVEKDGTETEEVLPAEYLQIVPEFRENGERNLRFITIGRMSPEKNHKAMLRAFARFHKETPASCLYILGNGALMEEMQALVAELGLGDAVFIPGNVKNPYIILKNCDCFILPSLHEGQPMVIHEARSLHMPIIVSDFSSVKGCLVENGQLVIGKTEEDIYGGFVAFQNGTVPLEYQFDTDTYNKEAVREFYTAIGAIRHK